ncbi:MAG: replication-relaxation family protein [Bifidobacteriaceae bacterium]|jgi:hypothetical protein|nr:replication-relaxation family protein [Bifidobacteriaceae bacterium]
MTGLDRNHEKADRRSGQAEPRGDRVSATRLDWLAASLSERDWVVLDSLAVWRLMTTDQLRRLHFTGLGTAGSSGRTVRAALRRLAVEVGAVRHLTRRIGGVRAGSSGYVWHLTGVGRRLLATLFAPAGMRRARLAAVAVSEPSPRTLDHSLAVSEVAVRLGEAGQAGRAGQLEVLRLEAEPDCWREHFGSVGQRLRVKPDLFIITGVAGGEFQDLWFVEVDRATETLATIRRKADAYAAYHRSGVEQARSGVFPRVLWVTPDMARAEAIQQELAGGRGRGETSGSVGPGRNEQAIGSRLHLAVPMGGLIGAVTGQDGSEPSRN